MTSLPGITELILHSPLRHSTNCSPWAFSTVPGAGCHHARHGAQLVLPALSASVWLGVYPMPASPHSSVQSSPEPSSLRPGFSSFVFNSWEFSLCFSFSIRVSVFGFALLGVFDERRTCTCWDSKARPRPDIRR